MKKKNKKKQLVFIIFIFMFLSGQILPGKSVSRLEETAKILKPAIEDKFEVSLHFSSWSLNPIKSLFESDLVDPLSKEIRREIANQVRDVAPGLIRMDYEQSLAFDSSGSNIGIEIRYYPKGRKGAFSLGFSLEKTNMQMNISGTVKQFFNDGTYGEVKANGTVKIKPFSSNLSFRWDMAPSWMVSPYFVLGVGIAPLTGDLNYDFTGTYHWAGPSETLEESDSKSLKSAEEEMDFNIPNIFVIVHMAFGLKAEIASHLILKVEAGVWDGFILRGGLGIRF